MWINDLINATLSFLIDSVMAIIGITGIPNSILNGILDNCVAGDTIVEGPDGDTRIDVLAERGSPFRVWSVTPEGERVAANAVLAFKKGSAHLFRHTLDDGRTITTTAQHKFLTDQGFVEAGDIVVGTRLATVDHDANPNAVTEPLRPVFDLDYNGMAETASVTFRAVTDITPLGVDDFYDMHVPGWENYSANGIWNHNTLFAFSTVENFSYRYTSPYMFPEKFFPSGPGGLTLDRLFAEAEALWNVRGYPSGQISFIDGYPYTVGVDLQRGQLVLYVYMGQLYIDYIENITIIDNRSQFNKVTIQLGDGKSEESGETRAQRKLVGLETYINLILGGGGSQ
jgi:Intein splicing domain